MRLELHFGALVPNILEQLSAADIVAKRDEITHWQRDADAIVRLNIRGLLSDSEAHAARKKLMRRITKGCKRKSPPDAKEPR